jgi:hypothetical protein
LYSNFIVHTFKGNQFWSLAQFWHLVQPLFPYDPVPFPSVERAHDGTEYSAPYTSAGPFVSPARGQALEARAQWFSLNQPFGACFVGPTGQASKMTANEKILSEKKNLSF